jgi:hypothetical protein
MTLSRPPPGGATCISGSTPVGGQMTPFDWASLSLDGAELPPPTVGGSPFVSGGHVAPFSRDGFALGCASAKFTAATVANAATRTTPACKANSSPIAERIHQRAGPQNVPHLPGEAARMRASLAAVIAVAPCAEGNETASPLRTNQSREFS